MSTGGEDRTAARRARFEHVVRDHHDRVARYLLARAGHEDAQDALSLTFEIAWRRIDDVPDAALPWLLGVARHVLLHQWRSRGRRDALIERMAATQARRAEHGSDVADGVTRREVALQAFRALSDADREVLLLVAWDGLSGREAADALGCSRATFAVRLHRARLRLQRAVDDTVPTAAAPHAEPLSGQSPCAGVGRAPSGDRPGCIDYLERIGDPHGNPS